tara:strand:- start:921 stop:1361 length:441 start_codon:yes stop_codon:yes gene_type:complete
MSHWTYQSNEFTEIPPDAFGFVYRITNQLTDQKYIGRKYFYSTRRVIQKGKKRRKLVTKESKWKIYTGSSEQLNEAIETSGKDNFTFEIVAIGYTKGQTNYLEENVQHKLNVLTDDTYYNYTIGSRGFLGVKKDDLFKKAVGTITL